MTQAASRVYASAEMQRNECIVSEFVITASSGAPTISANYLAYPVFIGGVSTDFTQALVDAFLGSTSEFAVTTAFGSTAMGTDMFGFVLNLQGQAARALWVQSVMQTSTQANAGVANLAQGAGTVTTVLPNTLTNGLAVTTAGNLYGRIVTAGFDTGATNILLVRVAWSAK